jgi:zinc D-Ala-D-Ala carboxypeptidase
MSIDWSKIKHFKKSEFDCGCGCGYNIMSESVLLALDTARETLGFPLVITSGCRCQKYNDRLKNSVPDSAHVLGLAVDIDCTESQNRFLLLSTLTNLGFKRFGIGKTFLHADLDASKPQYCVWLYS